MSMERKAAPNFSLAGSARRRLVANHHTESVITARYDAAEVQISVSRSDEWTKVCHSEEAQRADVGLSSTEQSINDKPINIEHPRFSMLISFFCFPLRCRRFCTGWKNAHRRCTGCTSRCSFCTGGVKDPPIHSARDFCAEKTTLIFSERFWWKRKNWKWSHTPCITNFQFCTITPKDPPIKWKNSLRK